MNPLPEESRLRIDPEFQAAIPPLITQEYADLEAMLLADGCRDALVVWQETGLLLDGHNRYAICQKHTLPFSTQGLTLPTRDAALDWIDANQLGRRNLTPDQASLLRGRRYNRAKKAEGAQIGNINAEKQLAQFEPVELMPPPSEEQPHSTAERLARQHGVSRETIKRDGAFAEAIETIKPIQPALQDTVLRGTAPPKSGVILAAAILETAPEKAKAILEGTATVAEVKRAMKREAITQQLETAKQTPRELLVTGPYHIIVADPPWEYDFSATESREIENQYPTATVDTICGHTPNAADGCALFLWVTAPKLVEGLQVMLAWGFTYKTCAVWDKEKMGMGYWFRSQHELILVGTKGQISPPADFLRIASVIRAPRGVHSQKPDALCDYLDAAYPGKAKLEMYSRGQRDGWAAWGNQV